MFVVMLFHAACHPPPIAMQWVDIDMYMGAPLKVNPKKDQPVPGSSVGQVPIIRMYGVSEAGNSAVVNVHGFTPYLYCKAPPYVPLHARMHVCDVFQPSCFISNSD